MSSSEYNHLFHSTKCLKKNLVCPFWQLMFIQDRQVTGSKKGKKNPWAAVQKQQLEVKSNLLV